MCLDLGILELKQTEFFSMSENAPETYGSDNALVYGSNYALDIFLKLFSDLGCFDKADIFVNRFPYLMKSVNGRNTEYDRLRSKCKFIDPGEVTSANAAEIFASGGVVRVYVDLNKPNNDLIINVTTLFRDELLKLGHERPFKYCNLYVTFRAKPSMKSGQKYWQARQVTAEYKYLIPGSLVDDKKLKLCC